MHLELILVELKDHVAHTLQACARGDNKFKYRPALYGDKQKSAGGPNTPAPTRLN
jgi:hypothetical protein